MWLMAGRCLLGMGVGVVGGDKSSVFFLREIFGGYRKMWLYWLWVLSDVSMIAKHKHTRKQSTRRGNIQISQTTQKEKERSVFHILHCTFQTSYD